MSSKSYQAGGTPFFYPEAGDPAPLVGAKVNVLTIGGISTTGAWDPSFCLAWAPLNSRDAYKEDIVTRVRSERRKALYKDVVTSATAAATLQVTTTETVSKEGEIA